METLSGIILPMELGKIVPCARRGEIYPRAVRSDFELHGQRGLVLGDDFHSAFGTERAVPCSGSLCGHSGPFEEGKAVHVVDDMEHAGLHGRAGDAHCSNEQTRL